MAKADTAYLYVISSDDAPAGEHRAKVGRSAQPLQRRSQLQVGQGGKLIVRGQYPVPAADAPALEAKLKAVLAPLKVKGEVFNANDDLACAVAKWIASGEEPDEFIRLAVARHAVLIEWNAQIIRPSASGRWAKPETVAAADATWAEYERLSEQLNAISLERADEADSFNRAIREPNADRPIRRTRRRNGGGASA